MTYSYICSSVERVVRRYKERDPLELCEAMGVRVRYKPMGSHPGAVKGVSLVSHRIKSITINSDLPDIIQRIVLAHELGHIVLHCTSEVRCYHEISLYDETAMTEKDANLFAAELLLEDDTVLDVLNQDVTFFGAAAALYIPVELLDFKFRLMKWKGYMLREPPFEARSTFLKGLEIPPDIDYSTE